MKAKNIFISILVISLAALAIAGCAEENKLELRGKKMNRLDLSGFKDTKPVRKMRLLFIHHSCGGQWLADKGETKELVPGTCLYESHPNGGGLRALLRQNNYEVHEAGYKSAIGAKTDVCDWNVKFRDMMEEILRCDRQDTFYSNGSVKNDIIMFKSCYPANCIESEGREPGDPDSLVKNTANYKAAYNKLLDYFKSRPNTLFVCVTAPPLVETSTSGVKEFVKRIIAPKRSVKATGDRARSFNNWLMDMENGWLKGYERKNVVVFDYYDVLTKHGQSNHALYPTGGGHDSHPSAEGNSEAAREFVPFLNKIVNRFDEIH